MDNKCKMCGSTSSNRFFCPQCGSLLNSESYNNSELSDNEEFQIKRIYSNLDFVPSNNIEWDATLNNYVRNIEKFKALLRLKGVSKNVNEELINKINSFIQSCCNPEFQIAFAGTIKTGKSTLINALLGANYASMAVTPETAALTKFRSSEKDYVKVTFYSNKEWTRLWNSISSAADKFIEEYKRLEADKIKNNWIGHEPFKKILANSEIEEELAVWSSSQRPEHYFVKEIEVGISTLPADFPKQVVFVDTPGLSDPVAYRSEITKRYIRRANAVFVCVEAKKLSKEEVETISSVFSISSQYKEKIYIIGTHYDVMNNPKEDWKVAKEFMVRQITGKGFFDNEKTANEHLIHSSAYQYNLCRDFAKLDETQKRSLMRFALGLNLDFTEVENCIPELEEQSNVDTIRKTIGNKLISNYSKFIREDLISQYRNILNDVFRYAATTKESANSIILASQESMADLKKRLDTAQERNKSIEKSKKQLLDTLEMVTSYSQKCLMNILKELEKSKL